MDNGLANGQFVADIQDMMAEGGFALKQFPKSLETLLRQGIWKHRVIKQTGKVASFDRFEDFVEANLCAGLESSVEQVRNLCRDNLVVIDLINQATQQPHGGNRQASTKSANRTLGSKRGTTREGALRRLRKSRPDLHAKVLKKELTPHGAMIEAGFRRKTLTVPLDVERAADVIKRHFTQQEITQLVGYLRGSRYRGVA